MGHRVGRSLDGFTALSWVSKWLESGSSHPRVPEAGAARLGLPLAPRVCSAPALRAGVCLTPVPGLSARWLSLSRSTSALHAPLLLE